MFVLSSLISGELSLVRRLVPSSTIVRHCTGWLVWCVVSENYLYQVFWFALTILFIAIIGTHGDEFVNRPKLHTD